ncbi:DNA polymerase delta subunit 3 [Nothoprocta perdicaria]|uniref:DNA polymerase delta subunit 3 n=1 Tax=Nothoprocta perdicaria TaxID=30464 RepID=UPI000E1C09FC|nr:DNA polymerase delta subunit 3 [Nothoprocta perdicaria]
MEDELYLENIDEFVTDQNRIVTYKWLSYTLGVHVNQAKQMLYDYVERKRKENSGAQLHVTYFVAGNLIQNGYTCHKIAVVREDKLEAMKSKLATLASVHVYSVQKALLKDSGPLYNTDYDIVKANLHNCSKVSSASSKPPAKVNVMTNFFGKAAMNKLKVNSAPEQPKEEKEVVKPSSPAAEPESSSSAAAEKPGRKTESAKIQQKDKTSKMKRMDKSSDEEEREPENLKKKRRRIKQLQSDSSDDEDIPPPSTPEEEKPLSPPPALKTELEPVPTEVSAGGKRRKRKRVLKSKMFIDEEEGCMVTEKVYESESCTDSEDDFAKAKPAAAPRPPAPTIKREPKEEKKNPKKGAATATKANKQVSIMGFFQKK